MTMQAPAAVRSVRQFLAVGAGSRFVGVLAVLIGALLLAGTVSRAVVAQRLDATESIRERSAAALIIAERLRAALARADATAAANVFSWVDLVPSRPSSPAERRENYDEVKAGGYYTGDHSGDAAVSGLAGDDTAPAGDGPAAPNQYSAAVRSATTALLELREVDPGECESARAPGSTSHCAMDRIATLIPEYVGLVAEASANTRAGNTVGGSYQRLASDLMATSILGQTNLLVTAYGDRVDADYRRATGGHGEDLLLLVLACALVALVGAQVYVYRRTRRILNAGLLAATGVLGAVAVACLVLLGGQQSRLSAAQRGDFVPMTLLAASRTLALEARTCEYLSLASLGNGDGADACFQRAVAGLGYGLDGRPTPTAGALSAALAELPAERAELAAEFTAWLRERGEVVATLRRPPRPTAGAGSPDVFDDVVGVTLRSEHFDRFITRVDGLVGAHLEGFNGEVDAGAADVRLLAAVLPIALLTAASCCVIGISARVREYL
ncbi:hypothetical protein BBK14_19775 [Parafrankia soli]|uniref:Uncharacterized protein n=2 Tax=Parafrankia soli TaxID=2599596 RepID=A0A1S1Q2I8_9ACTN|nr:hypothetical protein BBK14_19775 [Parafrankia soli]